MSSLPLNTGHVVIAGLFTSAANAVITSNGPSPHHNASTRLNGRVPITIVPGGPPNSGTLPRNTPYAETVDTARRRLQWLRKRSNQLERRQAIREAYGDSLDRHIINERRNLSPNQLPTERDEKYFEALDALGHANERKVLIENRIFKDIVTEHEQELCRIEKAELKREVEYHFANAKRMLRNDSMPGEGIGRKRYRIVVKPP
ncbi:uncharacterized protein H6S33_008055 [Morchella sextelata]|uniref:uncharacterized protein n=1 Tax=Morchella sextelata TaxID=1174677 RepID=UPI001D0469CD|nr:uncharacterized protein H6S33_008055 [Morchella sextelata]KAH0603051.1 hypothetical protein H6S33_008055 [Morchella sextelata]